MEPLASAGRERGREQTHSPGARPGRQDIAARLLLPLLVGVGLVLALIFTGSEATAASWTATSPGIARGSTAQESHHSADFRRDIHVPSSMHELASEPEEDDEDSFEVPMAACTPVLAAFFDPLEPLLRARASSRGRRLVSIGLGPRGPPR
ncbi:hypothetical protein [Paraliomyxa miuraensis]|uniref:hypothetical protein n=1 Tax=Paraliomyxa miuraensis TaxID=376150 RepID=UPI002257C3AE|nr:hypothetical protein [Paraliomyxa miuraensis]